MKIKKEHYETLKGMMTPLADKIAGHREYLKTDSRVKDLEKRLRWDLFWATRSSNWLCDNLYTYMDDSHLDTALKSIMKEIERA